MKKLTRYFLALLIMTLSLPFTGSVYANSTQQNCPDPINLVESYSLQEVRLAVQKLVPQKFPAEDIVGWQIIKIQPLKEAGNYYGIGKTYCGKEVADKSWFVEVFFPKFAPSESASKYQLFLAKDKEKGWSIWFVY